MDNHFEKVESYLNELGILIEEKNEEKTLFVVNDENRGIHNLIIDCEDELLVLEQVIFQVNSSNADTFSRLLQMNRELIHGAFALDEAGKTVLFRDTLQLQNLDLNELEASINALALGLADFADELIGFSKQD
ncbi:YbjN domain-containing protein [Terasakiella sp. A23]|uniref:YbjN domain-containing protein n=1 Tax=Terasakiella sp. FCG-A23 TaxID=3080561 RepID=UPI00295361DA|nr:YbjN domain-containing protein [Terasakiella sp. A23]MDV7339911.1 YbjN domain-containing protein [Terasakiella sp. A23]